MRTDAVGSLAAGCVEQEPTPRVQPGESGASELAAALHEVKAGLARVSAELQSRGLARLEVHGGLIRPLIGYAAARSIDGVDHAALWSALGAVQLAHEASLVHDDILDGASERRGRATTVAAAGIGAAVVLGDHLLTSAYRLAAETGSPAFTRLFARAVERTVAGEIRQARNAGRSISRSEYEETVLGKSGELLGCALAAGPLLGGDPRAPDLFELGRRLGMAYQMLDDFLDYVPGNGTGKPAFQDYAHRLWTWPLFELAPAGFDEPVSAIMHRLHDPGRGESVARRCLARLDEILAGIRDDTERLIPGDPVFTGLLAEWSRRAHDALAAAQETVRSSVQAGSRHDAERDLRAMLDSEDWSSSLRRYARSFSFAARWFPPEQRRRMADVYAVCRFTDEIVDRLVEPGHPATPTTSAPARDRAVNGDRARALLDAWSVLCRSAWNGTDTGVAFVDRAMRDARRSGVPFELFEDLVAGVAMDLSVRRYETWAELEVYTWRVASVVGLWLTRLFGVHDAATLERAAALGHAMQLTNILRDVGEDLDRDRIYIPADLLRRHGIAESGLRHMRATGRIPAAWRHLVEEVAAEADRAYSIAFEALPDLPPFFRRPVAVAAAVYRGIHDEIRRNDYDNVTRRAHTSILRKAILAMSGLVRLLMARRPGASGRSAALLNGAFERHDGARMQPGTASASRRTTVTAARLTGRAIALLVALNLSSSIMADRAVAQNQIDSTSAARSDDTAEQRLRTLNARLDQDPFDLDAALERVATLWLLAVNDGDAVRLGLAALDTIASRHAERIGPGTGALVLAYRGGLEALRGKHAFWPHDKLRHVRSGLARLDAAVQAAPDDARIRYVRLMSGFYLPGLFGRGDGVRADFDALSRLLPDARADFPPSLFPVIVRFVLDHGELPADERRALERALAL